MQSMANNAMDIDYSKYRLRKCNSLHVCVLCSKDITLGQMYHDGGYGKRAHFACVHADSAPKGQNPARSRGYMGGDVAGGADVDDADREPELVQVRIGIELLDEDGELDESLNAQSQDMDREKACGVIRRLRKEWHRAISDEPSTGCRVGHLESLGPNPTTVAEWVAQTEETGILEFDLLLTIVDDLEKAWGDKCADTLGEGMERENQAHAIIRELCSAIESHPVSHLDEFMDSARKRARDFLKENGHE
jgi:hypothetical protein